jgi:hypothetical protein
MDDAGHSTAGAAKDLDSVITTQEGRWRAGVTSIVKPNPLRMNTRSMQHVLHLPCAEARG